MFGHGHRGSSVTIWVYVSPIIVPYDTLHSALCNTVFEYLCNTDLKGVIWEYLTKINPEVASLLHEVIESNG